MANLTLPDMTLTQTQTSTKTVVATLVIAGAGLLAAAANMAMPPTSSARPPALLVRATPTQPRSVDAVRGSGDVALLSIDLQPGGGAAQVTNLTFSLFGDLDANFSSIARDASPDDRFEGCYLIDPSGATIDSGHVSGGTLIFSSVFIAPANRVSTYAVRCNLSATATTDATPDRFAASITGESAVTASIGGTALSGSSLVIGGTTTDTLNDTGAVSVRVIDDGRLAIRLASDTPASAIVLGSTSGADVGHWELLASNEAITVSTLTFSNVGTDADIASASLTCAAQDGSTVSHRAFVSSGRAAFSSANCYAPAGTPAPITLSVDTNAVSSTGAPSGSGFRFVLNATDAGTLTAVGMSSGSVNDETDVAASVSARQMTLRKTKPTFALASGSPSGAGTTGNNEVLRFNVAAASTGFVAANQLMFRVTSTDLAATGWNNCGDGASTKRFGANSLWNLYDANDLSTPLSDEGDWSLLKADGSACGQSASPVTFAVLNLGADATTGALEIAAGDTMTLVLKADTTGASATGNDTVRFDLVNESDARAISHSAVLWNDDTEATNVNASLLQVLPVTGGTITY